MWLVLCQIDIVGYLRRRNEQLVVAGTVQIHLQ